MSRNRTLRLALICGVVAAGLIGAGGCTERSESLVVGDAMPLVGLSTVQPTLVWVFPAARCLGCTLAPSARFLRGIQHRFGHRIAIVAVAITDRGEGDRALVRNFLQAERIAARIELSTRVDHANSFGRRAPAAAIYVTDDDRVVQILLPSAVVEWDAVSDDADNTGIASLMEHLESVEPANPKRSIPAGPAVLPDEPDGPSSGRIRSSSPGTHNQPLGLFAPDFRLHSLWWTTPVQPTLAFGQDPRIGF